jgi:hypothetical protein
MEHKGPAVLQCFRNDLVLKKQEKFSMEESASPSNSKSWLGMLTDIPLLKSSPEFFFSFVRIMDMTCSRELAKTFDNLSKILPNVHSPKFLSLPMKPNFVELFNNSTNKTLIGLGQLQQKEEAAGKMRTFAMVDS